MSTLIQQFQSPSNPDRSITYAHLNIGAQHTLIFCYGAASNSLVLSLYEPFLESHADLSLLCVDRWTQGKDAARTGPALLSELTSITLELLDSLKIDHFSIASHSAGVYQQLHLAQSAPTRVDHVFPISSHIPEPYTDSKIMNVMCSMPDFLFKPITKLDATMANTWIGKKFVGMMAKKDDEEKNDLYISSSENMKPIHERIITECAANPVRAEASNIDYRFGYGRIEGVKADFLTGLYRDSPVGITWYTSDGEVFFGPKCVERIAKDMDKVEVEIVNVPGATHADIYVRKDVWEGMYARMTRGREAS
ncbi:hypothetical protein N7448_003498 [Penicillium atrosanguineum]|uniref:uncharacterized protein n=1 Tax=Penicillium atrosanguineum TaxID=1132637 RepID=UPI0023A13739|nr:uncharacterized protein N7443_002467 [Penicillium atrosanguineum]KAJ5140090.1 hypothetical protein N7448_003498 [Penicillium atrosanguineum]KAJ5310006.1 hypothetical protein N7443_002467 [Penicillium atrosanguineum]